MTELSENEQILILLFGTFMSAVFAVFGLLVNRYKFYNLIAGYNQEPEAVKQQYDIKGLAAHVGNGLVTLGVLLFLSTVFLYFGLETWFSVSIGLFIFVAFLIPIGSRKFMPARRKLSRTAPGDAKHPFLHWLLPKRLYRSIEKATRQWLQVCKTCGHKQDFWEAGGVRGGGYGEPVKLQFCERCQQLRWHKIRRKTASEAREL